LNVKLAEAVMSPPQRTHQEILADLVPESDAKTYSRPERKLAVIIFTPRSGSSWLGDLLTATGVFGLPDEYANQTLLCEHVSKFARTETDYLNAMEQECASANGIFSIQATWGDISLFGTIDFFERYQNARYFCLRRRDIISQAISLHLAVETGLFHRVGSDEVRIEYTPSQCPVQSIKRWCVHILNFECMIEGQFIVRGINPMRLFYEELVEAPEQTVQRILTTLDLSSGAPTSNYKKLSSEKNDQLKAEFLKTEADFVRALYRLRPPPGDDIDWPARYAREL
jgi:LPS sulfotransferase NodH